MVVLQYNMPFTLVVVLNERFIALISTYYWPFQVWSVQDFNPQYQQCLCISFWGFVRKFPVRFYLFIIALNIRVRSSVIKILQCVDTWKRITSGYCIILSVLLKVV